MKGNSAKHLSPRAYLALVAVVCLVTLGIAYGAEHYFGLKPCILCLYQRRVFWALVGVGALGVCLPWARYQIYLLFAAGALFWGNAALAIYQVLIEKRLIEPPQICQATKVAPSTSDFAAFKLALNKTTLVPCDQVGWELWGISLAGYASLFTLMAGFFCIVMGIMTYQGAKQAYDA
jgi:disulfide bond formation protein DsbB